MSSRGSVEEGSGGSIFDFALDDDHALTVLNGPAGDGELDFDLSDVEDDMDVSTLRLAKKQRTGEAIPEDGPKPEDRLAMIEDDRVQLSFEVALGLTFSEFPFREGLPSAPSEPAAPAPSAAPPPKKPTRVLPPLHALQSVIEVGTCGQGSASGPYSSSSSSFSFSSGRKGAKNIGGNISSSSSSSFATTKTSVLKIPVLDASGTRGNAISDAHAAAGADLAARPGGGAFGRFDLDATYRAPKLAHSGLAQRPIIDSNAGVLNGDEPCAIGRIDAGLGRMDIGRGVDLAARGLELSGRADGALNSAVLPGQPHPHAIEPVTDRGDGDEGCDGDDDGDDDGPPRIGIYTPEERREMLERYRRKRSLRVYGAGKYAERSARAGGQPRVKGKFVSAAASLPPPFQGDKRTNQGLDRERTPSHAPHAGQGQGPQGQRQAPPPKATKTTAASSSSTTTATTAPATTTTQAESSAMLTPQTAADPLEEKLSSRSPPLGTVEGDVPRIQSAAGGSVTRFVFGGPGMGAVGEKEKMPQPVTTGESGGLQGKKLEGKARGFPPIGERERVAAARGPLVTYVVTSAGVGGHGDDDDDDDDDVDDDDDDDDEDSGSVQGIGWGASAPTLSF